jgi:hypothetical protein
MKIARVSKACSWVYPYPWSKPPTIGEEFIVLEGNYLRPLEGRVWIDRTGAQGLPESLPLDSVEIIDLEPVTELAIIVSQGFEGLVAMRRGGKWIGKKLSTVLKSKIIRAQVRAKRTYTHFGREPYPKPPWGSSLWVVRDGRLKCLVTHYDTSG